MDWTRERITRLGFASLSASPTVSGAQIIAVDFPAVPSGKHWIVKDGSLNLMNTALVGGIPYMNEWGFLLCPPSTPSGGALTGPAAWIPFYQAINVTNIPDSTTTTEYSSDYSYITTLQPDIVIPQLWFLKAFAYKSSWGASFASFSLTANILFAQEDNC